MTGRTLGVALILWPFASVLLLGLHRAGRATPDTHAGDPP